MPVVRVGGVPDWVDVHRLLDAGDWARDGDVWTAERTAAEAADLDARLRNLGMGGRAFEVSIDPPPKRPLVRAARAEDARRRRDTTPGFTRPGAKVDADGKRFLTPEKLALALGKRANADVVVDATAGCGGNAIGFARAGCAVIAVELDADRLALARENARVYGVSDRITFVCADAVERLATLSGDLLFLDPPWGEPDRIACREVPLLDALLHAGRHFERIWVKVPPSFVGLPGFAMEAWFGHAPGDRQRVKFVLLRNDR
ncbi:MAG: class I SAM-dependent methyltransferase [Alphaproteobacteria bacterium]|nr:class I SAM-dependent methyltransferase [Alphaproteobacteria bacterium]